MLVPATPFPFCGRAEQRSPSLPVPPEVGPWFGPGRASHGPRCGPAEAGGGCATAHSWGRHPRGSGHTVKQPRHSWVWPRFLPRGQDGRRRTRGTPGALSVPTCPRARLPPGALIPRCHSYGQPRRPPLARAAIFPREPRAAPEAGTSSGVRAEGARGGAGKGSGSRRSAVGMPATAE